MDLEKMLRAYIRHVYESEGTDFLNARERNALMGLGLSDGEADFLIRLAEQTWREERENLVARTSPEHGPDAG